jgi:hypothetical protein
MSKAAELVLEVQRWVAQTGDAPSRLAREAGLSPNALRHVRKPDWVPTLTTLHALEILRDRREGRA